MKPSSWPNATEAKSRERSSTACSIRSQRASAEPTPIDERDDVELRFVTPELRRLDEVGSEVLAFGVFSDERPPHGTAGLVDWRLSGQVSRLMRQAFVTGKRSEVVMLPLRPKL